jgi:YNFM family putative membrane transporter
VTVSTRIQRGSREFWRANIAFFLSGFSIFAVLYSVQPLLPIFAREFHIDAGASSLSLSATTIVLAVSMLFASGAADRWGRKTVMLASLVGIALLSLLITVMPDWRWIIVVRAALGLALSGLPAVALTYLGEEMEPAGLGFSIGLYIGGNGIGGMCGRLLVGLLTDLVSWRFALDVLGVVVLVNAALFWWLLPNPRHSHRRGAAGAETLGLARLLAHQFRDRGLPWLFAEGALVMGVFVTLYSYTGFRLSAPPYSLSHGTISFIFVVYLIGTVSSTWIGTLAGRLGRRKVLWIMVTVMGAGLALNALTPIVAIIGGLALLTFGFFGAHSVASSWVSRRAQRGKAQAASLYLFFFYVGSSVIGTGSGYAFTAWGWPGLAGVCGCILLAAFAISVRLYFLQPLPIPETPVEAPTQY